MGPWMRDLAEQRLRMIEGWALWRLSNCFELLDSGNAIPRLRLRQAAEIACFGAQGAVELLRQSAGLQRPRGIAGGQVTARSHELQASVGACRLPHRSGLGCQALPIAKECMDGRMEPECFFMVGIFF